MRTIANKNFYSIINHYNLYAFFLILVIVIGSYVFLTGNKDTQIYSGACIFFALVDMAILQRKAFKR